MPNITNLQHRVNKLLEQVGPTRLAITPCLVPPPDMPLFTEREQHTLQELERKVIPCIPTGPGSTIAELGGLYLSLFAICMPVSMALERMGVLDEVTEALTSHERWILPRWWTVYKGLMAPGSPEMEAHHRRHIFRTREELVERFLSIDFDRCPKAHYPLDGYGYKGIKEALEDETRRIEWYWLEQWYDFAEEHHLCQQ